MKRFEDSTVWQKSKQLSILVYQAFNNLKDFAFRDQIQRAAVSIMNNNVAEGFERNSDKEFRQFLFIAKGSAGEVRSMLTLALDLGYITKKDYQTLYGHTEEVSKLLAGFIRKL